MPENKEQAKQIAPILEGAGFKPAPWSLGILKSGFGRNGLDTAARANLYQPASRVVAWGGNNCSMKDVSRGLSTMVTIEGRLSLAGGVDKELSVNSWCYLSLFRCLNRRPRWRAPEVGSATHRYGDQRVPVGRNDEVREVTTLALQG